MGVSASQVAPEAASLLLGGVFNSLLPGLRLDNVKKWYTSEEAPDGQVHSRMCYDIIGFLPLELLLEVIEYLDPADVVRSQRVSKRWRSIFSSDAVIAAVLRRTLAFLNVEGADIREAAADAKNFFRWQHGLQHGLPIKKVFIPWPEGPNQPREVIYRSRRLYYYLDDFHRVDEVGMLDFETGEHSILDDEAADLTGQGLFYYPVDLLVSDQYVVKVTDWVREDGDVETSPDTGRRNIVMSVWDAQNRERRTTAPFPDQDGLISLRKDKLVIADVGWKRRHSIYIQDLGTNQSKPIEFRGLQNLWLWHVDADANILVAFEINWDMHPINVRQIKFTLTGRLLDSKRFRRSLPDGPVDKSRFKRPTLSRVCTLGSKSIRRLPYGDYDGTTIDLVYDYATDKFSIRQNEFTPFCFNRENSICTSQIAYDWLPWHGALAISNAGNNTRTIRPYRLHAGEVALYRSYRPRYRPDYHPGISAQTPKYWWTEYTFFALPFGDREVFGVASEDGIQVWFFNPKFTPDLPGAEPFLPMQESG